MKIRSAASPTFQTFLVLLGFLQTTPVAWAERAGAFHTVTPCRVLDTRNSPDGPALSNGVPRVFQVTGKCGIPSTAKAVSVNLTAVGPTGSGELRLSRGDASPTSHATLPFPAGTFARANNALVPLAANGAGTLSLLATVAEGGTAHAIVDVTGYFSTAVQASDLGLELYSIEPCRAYDSRTGAPLAGGGVYYFGIRQLCGLPPEAEVAVVNLTAYNPTQQGHFALLTPTVHPSVSTLNFNPGEPAIANGAVVLLDPSSTADLALWVAGSGTTHATIDVTGYFSVPVLTDEATIPVKQWQLWQTTLTSKNDYPPRDAYADVLVTATFKRVSTNSDSTLPCPNEEPSGCNGPRLPGAECFRGLGFWDGPSGASAERFRLRSAFPTGKWCWWTKCTRRSNGLACTGEAGGLEKAAQVIKVTNVVEAPLYGRGMPRVKNDQRQLIYNNAAVFPPLADTAWEAVVAAAKADSATPPPNDVLIPQFWFDFITSRAADQYSMVLLAPAPQYETVRNCLRSRTGFYGFDKDSSCMAGEATEVIPNPSIYWDPAYWARLDRAVAEANRLGVVPIVAGLIDPLDRGGPPLNRPYPSLSETKIFADNLAARLAGHFVFFSLGFDDRLTDPLAGGGTVQTAMIEVGRRLKGTEAPGADPSTAPIPVVPRHLVTNQLAARSPTTDYTGFQSEKWLSFQAFQSGHGANIDPDCPRGSSATNVSKALCRAREITEDLMAATPRKPVMNSEGPYEEFNDGDLGESTSGEHSLPDNRNGVRHASYLSALSGAFGFTLGVEGIYQWDAPQRYKNGVSVNGAESFADDDLVKLNTLMGGAPWVRFVPRPTVIVGYENQTDETKKMALAEATGYALLYMPNGNGTEVTLRTGSTGIANLGCFQGNCCGWTCQWVNPTSSLEQPRTASCSSPATSQVKIEKRPFCPSSSYCDWVLRLTRSPGNPCPASTSSLLSGKRQQTAAAAVETMLEAWSTVDADSPTTGIAGQLYDDLGQPTGAEIEIAATGETVNKLPAVACDSQGDFLVAWEAADLDGSLHGIFGRRVSGAGSLIGERFQINSHTAGDQASPWVAADPLGGFVAVWTSHEQDGDQGGIYGQRLATDGSLLVGELAVNTTTAGHQFLPQVAVEPSGDFVVAWTSEEQDGSGEGVYAQRYNRDGQRLGEEFQVNTAIAGDQRLWALLVDKSGNISIQWHVLGEDGQPLGVSQQVFDADGNPIGGEEPVELP